MSQCLLLSPEPTANRTLENLFLPGVLSAPADSETLPSRVTFSPTIIKLALQCTFVYLIMYLCVGMHMCVQVPE